MKGAGEEGDIKLTRPEKANLKKLSLIRVKVSVKIDFLPKSYNILTKRNNIFLIH